MIFQANPPPKTHRTGEHGNMLFIILLAVVLIGALTAAVQNSGNTESANIDDETLIIRTTEVQRYAAEIERALSYVKQNAISENDIRFSHGDAPAEYGTLDATPANNTHQVFHPRGGAATYRLPPEDVLASAGQRWEFYGSTEIPQIGSDRTDLVAVIPNVTQQFCEHINRANDITGQPTDDGSTAASGLNAGSCINGGSETRFGSAANKTFFDSGAHTKNTMNSGTFSRLPAKQACVQCGDNSYHFYHVLSAR